MRGMLVGIIFSTVLCSGIFAVAPAVHALTLIPPSVELNVTPGQKIETEVKLFNETQEAVQLYTEAVNFTADGETGNPSYDFGGTVTDLSSWFQIEKGPIALTPGQRLAVPITLNIPADAEPGGHYAALFFSNTPPQEQGAGQIAIGMKLGTLFLVRVEGTIVEQGSLEEFFLEAGKSTLSRLPAHFFLRFQNTGNIHLRPAGTVNIINMFGKKAGSIDVNPGKGATLPKTIRQYEAAWEKERVQETTGNIWTRFWKEFSNEKNNFALGKYTANLSIIYGLSSDQHASAQVSFWVIPWRVLSVGLAALVILLILVVVLLKRYNAWIIKRAHEKKS